MIKNNEYLIKKSMKESKDLVKFAMKIQKIPDKFTTNGKIDRTKIELMIIDYHRGRLTF